MRLTKYLILTVFFYSGFLNGQNLDLRKFDYSKTDSIALTFSSKKYLKTSRLVSALTKNIKTDHEKLRAIFRWIADNIEYKYGFYSEDAEAVLKNRKAVCAGYAALLKEMCSIANIECEVISGYAKTTFSDIDKELSKPDHAWNAVKLNGTWYLLDVTWAASYFNERTRKFVKEFNNTYFLASPQFFVKKHFPEDKKWQLIQDPVTKSTFVHSPIYYEGCEIYNINYITPINGVINLQSTDTLKIKFKDCIAIDIATIKLDNASKYHPTIRKENDYYIVRKKFDVIGTYKMTFSIGNNPIVCYKLIIEK